MAALLFTTLFTEKFTMTLIFGIPFAAAVSVFYFVMRKCMVPADDAAEESSGEGNPDGDTELIAESV